MCGRPGQIPVLKCTRLCRRPVTWLVMKSGSCHDLDGENNGDEPVDGCAERRPPPCAGEQRAGALHPPSMGEWRFAAGVSGLALGLALAVRPAGAARRAGGGSMFSTSAAILSHSMRLRGVSGTPSGGYGRPSRYASSSATPSVPVAVVISLVPRGGRSSRVLWLISSASRRAAPGESAAGQVVPPSPPTPQTSGLSCRSRS
jgi:hypothetical protein